MLEHLLAEIRLGGTWTTSALARRLNTSIEMIDVLLERLVQFGFIQSVEPECKDANCKGCSLTGLCKKTSPDRERLWTLS